MALIVKVFINDRCIIDTHAVRVMGQPGHLCMYKTDTNRIIPHHYDDGGAALAIKLLNIYQEEVDGFTGDLRADTDQERTEGSQTDLGKDSLQ